MVYNEHKSNDITVFIRSFFFIETDANTSVSQQNRLNFVVECSIDVNQRRTYEHVISLFLVLSLFKSPAPIRYSSLDDGKISAIC